MKEKCLTQVVEDIPGRKIILSAGIGVIEGHFATVEEVLEWLKNDLNI